MILKRITPKSLFSRFLLIIIIPTVLVQLVATFMFYERHWKNVSRYLANSLGGEISWVVEQIEASPEQYPRIVADAQHFFGLEVLTLNTNQLEDVGGLAHEDLPYAFIILHKKLQSRVVHPFDIDLENDSERIVVRTALPERLVEIRASRKRLLNPTTYIFILWMSGTALVLLVVAILFIRGQVRSILKLTKAAEQFGKGEENEDYKPQGAKEIRKAGHAFIQMQERIRRFVQQRTDMLAGISHDLRTPLTRMKLQLALAKDHPATESLEEDVDEMEAMLEEYVDFLRGVGQEKPQHVSLPQMIGDIVEDYTHHTIHIDTQCETPCDLSLRMNAMKRCFSNLINNAMRHASRVIISTNVKTKRVRIFIDDNGPGIPKEKYDAVFQPFTRLDSSRNNETGGAGLGLSIVRDIIHSHGGRVSLDESPLGGLRVVISLPR